MPLLYIWYFLFNNQPKLYPEKFRQFYDSRMHTTTSGNHSIRYIGPIIWSKLSMRIKSSETLSSFKNQQVREVDIENDDDDDDDDDDTFNKVSKL